MAAKVERLDDLWLFWCPGCKTHHPIDQRWTFNGNLERPTFTPSLLTWASRPELRCHLFVTDGALHFLGDCYHELAGQVVAMGDVASAPFGD